MIAQGNHFAACRSSLPVSTRPGNKAIWSARKNMRSEK